MAKPNLPRTTKRAEQKYWRINPVMFATNELGVSPWEKQRIILKALAKHNRVAVRSCNGSGKTFTAALATIWWLMAHDEAIVITTAPTERQVKELLWRELRSIHFRNRDLIGGKITSSRLEISNRRYAFGFSTNTAERFQGFHHENILIIVDEASGVDEFIFDAITGIMTTSNAKILMIGNPTNLAGTFYDAFHKNRNRWETIHISAFDTPAFAEGNEELVVPGMATADWAETIAQDHGTESQTYQIRVLGQFPSQANDTLIPLKHIEAAVNRPAEPVDEDKPVMGLDVARFGDSSTVSVVRRGTQVLDLAAFPKADLMQTVGRALDIARRHDVKTIYVDEVGMGAGVLDRMKEIDDIEAVGVNVGNKAKKTERFANLRAQMLDGLRKRFADNDISIPDDAELISQLASLTYAFTSRGQLQIESKDQIRASGRQSPDKADALTLAFNAPKGNPLQIWILGRPESPSARRRRRRYRLD